MTEFPRLLRSGSPLQRAMLEAAHADAPSSSSHKRLLLALGGAAASAGTLGQGTSTVGSSSSPTASSSLSSPTASGIGETAVSTNISSLAAPAATSLAVPASAISTALLAKWLIVATLSLVAVGVGAIVGAAVARMSPPWYTASVRGSTGSAQPPSLSRTASSQVSAGSDQSVTPAVAAPTLPLPPPNSDLNPNATHGQGLTQPTALRPSANRLAPEQLTVADETALVEKAREALKRGDPAGCLSLLEIRRKGVRGGVLAPEAAILRIDALRALGQRARAGQEAIRFAHEYPDSPLNDRIRDLLVEFEP